MVQTNTTNEKDNSFLNSFKANFNDVLVGVHPNSYNKYSTSYSFLPTSWLYEYDEVMDIINSNDLTSKRRLSAAYATTGIYSKIIKHYASLLLYYGVLIQNPIGNTDLSNEKLQSKYKKALSLIDRSNFPMLFTRLAEQVLINGAYYGCLTTINKKGEYILVDLPYDFARVKFKDINNRYLAELNLLYFNSILDPESREAALKVYPEDVRIAYYDYIQGRRKSKWYRFSGNESVVFTFNTSFAPELLATIPAIMKYENALDIDEQRAFDQIRHILIQKIAHNNDNELLFQPPEALSMHNAAVNMLKGNDTVSVLTTYNDVQDIPLGNNNDNNTQLSERMTKNIYNVAGTSNEIYSATGNLSLSTNLINETSYMLILGRQFASFIENIVNSLFGKGNHYFTYKMLPITLYNQLDYIKIYKELANNGYSYILPAVASGISQNELLSLKTLENDILNLRDILVPLQTSYTSSNNEVNSETSNKDETKKSQRTIENEIAMD